MQEAILGLLIGLMLGILFVFSDGTVHTETSIKAGLYESGLSSGQVNQIINNLK